MALENSDVFVVQKATGEIRKVTASALNNYLESGDSVNYRGTGDFTDVGENPAAPAKGDLYFNDAAIDGNFAWLPAPNPAVEVSPGDRAIFNGTGWDIISSGAADVGVVEIQNTEPITVNNSDPSKPVIGVDNATQDKPGVVQLAKDADITAKATNRVVTADQLKAVEDKADAGLAGGIGSIIGVDPIEVATTGAGSATSPAVSIKDAAVGQKGAISKFDTTTDISGPETVGDHATWLAALDDTGAATIKAVATSFLLADFAEYPDA